MLLSGLAHAIGNPLARFGLGNSGRMASAAIQGARGAYSFANMGSIGQRAITGATIGGLAGAFSNDTSILGGAAMGAGIGAGGTLIGRSAAKTYGSYQGMRAFGFGRGRSASFAASMLASRSKNFINNTRSRAVNAFKARKGTFNHW